MLYFQPLGGRDRQATKDQATLVYMAREQTGLHKPVSIKNKGKKGLGGGGTGL